MTKKTIKKLCVPAIYFLTLVIAFTLGTGQSYAQVCESVAEYQTDIEININNGPNFLKINSPANDNGKVVLHTTIVYANADLASVCLSVNEEQIEDLKLEEDDIGRLNVHCRKGQITAAEDYQFDLAVGSSVEETEDFIGQWNVQSPPPSE